MRKPTLIALIIVMSVGILPVMAQSDTCDVVLIVGPAVDTPCPGRVAVPVYLHNPCPVGGFNIQVSMTDPSWAAFDSTDPGSADTVGACISNWESFDWHISGGDSQFRIQVVAIADMPGGDSGIYLPPGDCLLFTAYPYLKQASYGLTDTCQLLNFGTVQISDETGYELYNRTLVRNELCLNGTDIRGDVNNSGAANGLDVTCLVNYLKGSSFVCFCGGRCGGDTNGNGVVNGLDVTYMVNYLKGGPLLPPCEQ